MNTAASTYLWEVQSSKNAGHTDPWKPVGRYLTKLEAARAAVATPGSRIKRVKVAR